MAVRWRRRTCGPQRPGEVSGFAVTAEEALGVAGRVKGARPRVLGGRSGRGPARFGAAGSWVAGTGGGALWAGVAPRRPDLDVLLGARLLPPGCPGFGPPAAGGTAGAHSGEVGGGACPVREGARCLPGYAACLGAWTSPVHRRVRGAAAPAGAAEVMGGMEREMAPYGISVARCTFIPIFESPAKHCTCFVS